MKVKALLNDHPELESEKSQLEKITQQLGNPDIPLDKPFLKQLKYQIKAKIQEKKAENPRYLAFYLRNFRFYFSGFSVALGAFCILFVLGFFSFNKTPELLNNPKVLNYRENLAFGTSTFKNQVDQEFFPQAFAVSSLTERAGNFPFSSTITQAPNRYHIGEKQLPKLEKEYFIIKKLSGTSAEFKLLTKGLKFPDFKASGLKTAQIQHLEFTTTDNAQTFFLDLKQANLRMQSAPNLTGTSTSSSFKPLSDSQIKKAIQQQLNQWGISLANYGTPTITSLPYSKSEVQLFYPRLVNGKTVWNSNNRSQEGLELIFNQEQQKIESFYNLDLQSYELSKYPFNKTTTELLIELEQHGNIDTSKKGETTSIAMQKGKVIWLDQGDFLVPALLFQEVKQEKTIILPLY